MADIWYKIEARQDGKYKAFVITSERTMEVKKFDNVIDAAKWAEKVKFCERKEEF